MKSKQYPIERSAMTAVITAITIMCLFAQAGYAAASPVISVEPAYTDVSEGENFTVNITVDPQGVETFGAQYYLHFDNTLLNATEQMPGTFLSHDGASTMNMVNEINNTIGIIEYGETRTIVDYGVTDPGVLASVTFNAIEPGVCDLTLKDVVISDTTATEIPDVTVRTGHVGINQTPTPFVISGYVSHEDVSGCGDLAVNVTNLNGRNWAAATAENYYQIVLASPNDVIAGDTLRFEVVCGDRSTETEHTVTHDEVGAGGFEYNITLELRPGDVNGDGSVDSTDAAIALQMAVCGEYDTVADVNDDNVVTSLDALMILQAAAGHITFDR